MSRQISPVRPLSVVVRCKLTLTYSWSLAMWPPPDSDIRPVETSPKKIFAEIEAEHRDSPQNPQKRHVFWILTWIFKNGFRSLGSLEHPFRTWLEVMVGGSKDLQCHGDHGGPSHSDERPGEPEAGSDVCWSFWLHMKSMIYIDL